MREGVKNKKVLVIGDTIVDKDVFLDAVGLSLESPTLKANYVTEKSVLGGAANVARLLGIFGCDCTFVTALSDKNLLLSFCKDYSVSVRPITNKSDNIKTRYWISKGDETYKYLQVNRCDNTDHDFGLDSLADLSGEYDAILISDYRCGLITSKIISDAFLISGKRFVCSQMSDRGSNMDKFLGFDVGIMNEKEYQSCTVDFPAAVVTLGSKGSKTVRGNTVTHHDPVSVVPQNTIGAGDAFCACYVATENESLANKFASYYLSLKNRDADSLKRFFSHEQ